MILIHVGDNPRFRLFQLRYPWGQDIRRLDPVDLAEAGDNMGPFDRHPVEIEILEPGEHASRRMTA